MLLVDVLEVLAAAAVVLDDDDGKDVVLLLLDVTGASAGVVVLDELAASVDKVGEGVVVGSDVPG